MNTLPIAILILLGAEVATAASSVNSVICGTDYLVCGSPFNVSGACDCLHEYIACLGVSLDERRDMVSTLCDNLGCTNCSYIETAFADADTAKKNDRIVTGIAVSGIIFGCLLIAGVLAALCIMGEAGDRCRAKCNRSSEDADEGSSV